MNCKRFALVGSGFIGQVHAASLARHDGSELTMVADVAPERAQALAARYGARAVTVSEALRSDAIDAVLIASSTPSHAELLEAAARAGKAVYCEKPIDLSLARAREVVERVLPLNVPVTVGFNRRFDSSHQQLRRQLEQGLIGRVELVQMVCRASSMPPRICIIRMEVSTSPNSAISGRASAAPIAATVCTSSPVRKRRRSKK